VKHVITVCSDDDRAVKTLSYNAELRSLAIGKVTTLYVYSIDHNKLFKRSVAHQNNITGMCWATKQSIIYTCSLDGIIYSWDYNSEAVSQNITQRRMISKATDSYYGIMPSNNSTILWSVENFRMKATQDTMYRRKKPYGLATMIYLDQEETTIEAQLEGLKSKKYINDILRGCINIEEERIDSILDKSLSYYREVIVDAPNSAQLEEMYARAHSLRFNYILLN